MKIGVQARELSGSGGTRTYLYNVLSRLASSCEGEDYFVCCPGELPSEISSPCVSRGDARTDDPVLSDHLALPLLLSRRGLDVAWFPKNVVPPLYRGPSVVTVHDLGYFVHPEYYPFLDRAYMKRMIRHSCASADRIIAVSRHTKDDITRFTSARPGKIEVVYHGVDDRFWREPSERDLRRLRETYRLGDEIVYGGNVARRKNVCTLIEAFCDTDYRRDEDAELVLTGGTPTDRQATKIAATRNVRHLGRLDDAEVPVLYRASNLLVYLSLYEGFGLPPLEAMASGTPVIASRRSSLPEVVGNAGILVDPTDAGRIADTIDAVMTNEALRERLRADGVERAREFTWERSASLTLEAIKRAA